MKIIKFNKENVSDKEVEDLVVKSRGIILNEQGKALIVKYAGLYMFPGGRIEEKDLNERDALNRELQEESGISKIKFEDKPFLKIESYDRNYYTRRFGRNVTRLTETYFYFGKTDEQVNMDKQCLTENEKKEKFLISFENLSVIHYLASTNKAQNKKIVNFNRELFTAMEEFTKYREKDEKVK